MNFEEFKERFQKVPVEEIRCHNREEPILTVKVIAYNHADFIRQCLDSILDQDTEYDYEVLIAEDDSSDGTREICLEYQRNYPEKIRLLLNSRENNITVNNKPTGNFNSIFSAFSIKSKYVALCEADDYWTDKYSIQKRVGFLEKNPECVLCFHDAVRYDQERSSFNGNYVSSYYKRSFISKEAILNCSIPTSSLLFRNNLIDIYVSGQESVIVGDMLLRAKLMNYGYASFISEISPSIYRVHKGGIFSMQSIENRIKMTFVALYFILDYFRNKGWSTKVVYNEIIFNSVWFFMNAFRKYRLVKVTLIFRIIKNVIIGRTFPLKIIVNRINSKI